MKNLMFYIAIITIFITNVVCAQIDVPIPSNPKPRQGGKKSHKEIQFESPEYIKQFYKLYLYHKNLVYQLSNKWKSCGGDNLGMTSLPIIITNLLAAFEDHKKIGMQPESCETCKKKNDRFQCLRENNGLEDLKGFIKEQYVLEFLMDHYSFNKTEAKKLISSIEEILSEQNDAKKD